jgi:hypothetical protein
MKIPVNLQELLQQSDSAISSISALIGQGLTLVNCTGVDSIAPELLDLLFTNIPQDWDFQAITEVIDLSTVNSK